MFFYFYIECSQGEARLQVSRPAMWGMALLRALTGAQNAPTAPKAGSFGKVAGMWGAGGGAGPMAQRGRTRGRCLASPGTGAWCRPPLVAPIRGYHRIWLISRSLPSCNLPIRPSDRAGFVTRNHEHLSWQLEQNLQRRRDKSQAGSFLNVQPARTGT